jgi:NAD(P)H-flavin reductase
MYRGELGEWQKRDDLEVHLTVDKSDNGWQQHVGVVPAVLEGLKPSAKDTLAVVCGPPIMLKFTLPALAKLGFPDEAVILSLEMRMKCGIGKCGRCNIGGKYVCRDGPVFTRQELGALPAEY